MLSPSPSLSAKWKKGVSRERKRALVCERARWKEELSPLVSHFSLVSSRFPFPPSSFPSLSSFCTKATEGWRDRKPAFNDTDFKGDSRSLSRCPGEKEGVLLFFFSAPAASLDCPARAPALEKVHLSRSAPLPQPFAEHTHTSALLFVRTEAACPPPRPFRVFSVQGRGGEGRERETWGK